MKKLAFIFGLFCSMYCYSDNNPISQIQQYNQKLSVEEATQIYEMETKYAKKYNIEYYFNPDNEPKDPSDFAKKYDLNAFKELLESKIYSVDKEIISNNEIPF